MKNWIQYLLCFTAIFSSGACEKTCDPPPPQFYAEVENGNYIMAYVKGRIILDADYDRTPGTICWLIIKIYEPETYYSQWVPSYWLRGAPKYEQYDEIAMRNGDTGFTGRVWNEMPIAFELNFAEMHLTCDKDWDEAHPAGVPLDDVVEFSFRAYGPYIRSGYKTDPPVDKYVMLSEVTADELYIIDRRAHFSFTIPDHLTDTEFQMTLRYIDIDGKSDVAKCRIETN